MKYKVGDRVKIVSQRTTQMNPLGNMDCWLNQTMTIASISGRWYKMREDNKKWKWDDDMIDALVETELIAEDAWKLAKTVERMKQHEIMECFGVSDAKTVFTMYGSLEAKNAFDAWMRSKTISVGDIVIGGCGSKALVTMQEDSTIYLLYEDGSVGDGQVDEYEKVGRCIDVKSILGQIGGSLKE